MPVWHDPAVPSDLARAHAVFDLAMRIGEGMLVTGAAASEVTATMLRVITSSGIRNVSVSVTFNEVSISYLPSPEQSPFTRIRAAGHQSQNFTKLDAYEKIAERYVRGDLTLEQANAAATRIPGEKPVYPLWLVILALACMGGAAALGLGAGPLVIGAATLAAGILGILTEVLMARQVPLFYIQMLGGVVGAFAAIIVHLLDPTVNSSIVVVACIIILLAGLTSLGAMQDAITGWYVTASGRVLETLMLTIGLVVGVRAGLLVAEWMDLEISVSSAMPVTLSSALVLVVSGALTGLGYAVATSTPARSLTWCSLLAAVASLGSNLLAGVGLDRVWAVGFTALAVGAASVLLAARAHAPALTFVLVGVIPMVPGSRIYRGLLALGTDLTEGTAQLFGAAEVAVAIAAGAVLGQIVMTRILATSVSSSSVLPVISAPFTTLRRRRAVGVPRARAGRSAGPALVAEAALPTTGIPAISLDDAPDLDAPEWAVRTGPDDRR